MNMELEKLKDRLSKDVFGNSRTDALEQGVCVNCGLEAMPRCYSAAGRREYLISGLCELCFDEITKEED